VICRRSGLAVPGQIEGQAPEAPPERAGQDREPGPGRRRVAVHEDDGAAVPLALQERDLLTVNSDRPLVHVPYLPR
jgi:hypothetical protein